MLLLNGGDFLATKPKGVTVQINVLDTDMSTFEWCCLFFPLRRFQFLLTFQFGQKRIAEMKKLLILKNVIGAYFDVL